MNDFDFDAMQKKRIARGAYNRVTHSGCSLPSDNLTDAQKRKLNGPITTLNLNKPMAWKEFKKLDHEHQVMYVNHLISFYHANYKMLAEMFGISYGGIANYFSKNKMPSPPFHSKTTDADILAWRMFRAGQLPLQKGAEDTADTENSIEDTPVEPETAPERIEDTPAEEKPIEKCESVNYLLQFNGVPEWESIFDVLKNLPLDHAQKVEVKVWA